MSEFPRRIFMHQYYRQKPERLYERMNDAWCPQYMDYPDHDPEKNQEYVHIEEYNDTVASRDAGINRLVRELENSRYSHLLIIADREAEILRLSQIYPIGNKEELSPIGDK